MDGIAGLSLLDCFDEEGEVDMERFSHFQRIQMEEFDDIDELVSDLEEEDEEEGDDKRKRDAKTVASNRSKRSVKKRHTLLYRDTDGSVKPLTWDKSIWYLNYIENPKPGEKNRWNEKFRKRFRMQYESFIELAMMAEASPKFDRWKRKDAVGLRSAPTRLMLLGALRYIGRGWTFDDIEEATAIHEETHRQFFHVFIDWGSSVLFDEWVVPPQTVEDLREHTAEFVMAGFNGCIGSIDATHVSMERCSHWLWQSNKGFKLNMPSRTTLRSIIEGESFLLQLGIRHVGMTKHCSYLMNFSWLCSIMGLWMTTRFGFGSTNRQMKHRQR